MQTVERGCDYTLLLHRAEETTEATAKHPFLPREGWKDAADLQAGDEVRTRGDELVQITRTRFSYEPKQVYNFEVAEWHTYFVGKLAWLVHNATPGKCLSDITKGLPNKGSKRWNLLTSLKKRLNNLGFGGNARGNSSVRGMREALAKVNSAEADYLGKSFVRDGHRVTENGMLISKDGTRLYRPPTIKNSPFSQTGKQANFVERRLNEATGKWEHIKNGHVDVAD